MSEDVGQEVGTARQPYSSSASSSSWFIMLAMISLARNLTALSLALEASSRCRMSCRKRLSLAEPFC